MSNDQDYTREAHVQTLLAQVPAIRQETWTRTVDYGGAPTVTSAHVSVLPGEVVVVTAEVLALLLAQCGFQRDKPDTDAGGPKPVTENQP